MSNRNDHSIIDQFLPRLSGVRFAEKWASIQDAINDSASGMVVIPPDYIRTDSFTNPSGVPVVDWRSLPSRSVREFGATGNGTDDDTVAIQAAVNSRANGLAVLFPPGIYLTSAPITLPANVFLVGAGMGEAWNGLGVKSSVIKNVTNGNTFLVSNTTAVRLEGLTLSGGVSTGAHLLIDGGSVGGNASSEIIVEFCTFLGKDNAVKMTNTVFQVFLLRSIFSAQNAGGVVIDASAGIGDTSIILRECWVRGSGGDGIGAFGAAGVVNFVVEKCQVSNIAANGKSAINLNNVSGASITNNDIESITGTGTANGIWVQGSSAVHIEGNTIYDVRGNASIYGSTMYRSRIGTNRILKGGSGATYAIQLDGGCLDNFITDQHTDFATQLLNSGATSVVLIHGALTLQGALNPATPAAAAQAGSLYQGSGVPNNANGANGDIYFRTDTPGTANQRMYIKSAGAWVALTL